MTELEALAARISTCTLCPLSQGRTQAVPGDGCGSPGIMFIGEAPGFHEDRQGKPFVGPAGQFLEQLLASIGLSREDVYITNMVKCRPPNNREPLPGELEACKPYLDKQIELLKPKVIVTLGRYSLARFFPREIISKARGKARKWSDITIFPMYHPAAALHQNNLKATIENDIKALPSILREGQGPSQEQGTEAQQLTMF